MHFLHEVREGFSLSFQDRKRTEHSTTKTCYRMLSNSMNYEVEEEIDHTKMMDSKRSLCSIDPSSFSLIASKRHKPDSPISTKERKEKIGERIVALQQLVSPYGKTDTASVLLEAMEYIRFLQEQVKVLSAPYLQSLSTVRMQELELYHCSLRNRGLCLVPIECTAGVAAGSNGADIWAPIKTFSPNFEKPMSEFN